MKRIYLGDCLDVCGDLLSEGVRVDLIYIDPPFGIKADEKFGMVPWRDADYKSDYDIIDMFPIGAGEKSYLHWIYPRLKLMRELLSDKGSIYVHVDWHVGHYVKILMDEIFGKENFINEIAWCYKSGGAGDKGFAKKHDTIFFYKKSDIFIFNNTKEKSYMGIGYSTGNKNVILYDDNDGKGPYTLVNVKDWWADIGMIATSKGRYYATQKPEALLERIIKASSNEDSIVADFYAGSGTTGAVAEKLGRKWIMSDISEKAVNTCEKRLNIKRYKEVINA